MTIKADRLILQCCHKMAFFLWGEKINTKNFNDMTRFSPYKTNFCIWMVLLLALIRRFPGDRQYKSYRVFPIWWLSIQIFNFFLKSYVDFQIRILKMIYIHHSVPCEIHFELVISAVLSDSHLGCRPTLKTTGKIHLLSILLSQ